MSKKEKRKKDAWILHYVLNQIESDILDLCALPFILVRDNERAKSIMDKDAYKKGV